MFIANSPFAGWCRVIWNEHREELTELTPEERAHFMTVTFAVEAGLLTLLQPAKINLASLGTGLRHVHWHVVPRFPDDSHFPEPVWAAPLRPPLGPPRAAGFRRRPVPAPRGRAAPTVTPEAASSGR